MELKGLVIDGIRNKRKGKGKRKKKKKRKEIMTDNHGRVLPHHFFTKNFECDRINISSKILVWFFALVLKKVRKMGVEKLL